MELTNLLNQSPIVFISLPSANEVCEGYVFTARKRSLGQGNIFTPVWHTVHGGGDAIPACLAEGSAGGCLGRGCAPRGYLVETPPQDGYCCRQYASYWNAFLLQVSVHRGSTWAGTPTPQAGTPPWPQCMLGYGQQVGSTHLTRMHSCSFWHLFELFLKIYFKVNPHQR